MYARPCLLAFVAALLAASFTGFAGEKKPSEDVSEIKVRLRLNAIETVILLERYETLFKREQDLQDSVRACTKDLLPQYQQALLDTQGNLDMIRLKLVTLESEKTKLTARLGKKEVSDAYSEQLEKTNRTLEKILDGLNSIDKRLEKMERPK
jgi:hypothetical protein